MQNDTTVLNLSNREVLYKVAKPVEKDEDLSEVLAAMKQVIKISEIPALGLAAPQIGSSKRVIILNSTKGQQVIVNPRITRGRLGKGVSMEMCLSVPGLTVKRQGGPQLIAEGVDEDWRPVRIKARGLDSYVIQHEIDHLNGIVIGPAKQARG